MNQWHQSVSVSAVQLIFAGFLGHFCVHRRQIREISVLSLGNCALTLESAASVDAPEGETYWKLIGLHHYLPKENQGRPNVFTEVLDEAVQRLSHPIPGPAGRGKARDLTSEPTRCRLDSRLDLLVGRVPRGLTS